MQNLQNASYLKTTKDGKFDRYRTAVSALMQEDDVYTSRILKGVEGGPRPVALCSNYSVGRCCDSSCRAVFHHVVQVRQSTEGYIWPCGSFIFPVASSREVWTASSMEFWYWDFLHIIVRLRIDVDWTDESLVHVFAVAASVGRRFIKLSFVDIILQGFEGIQSQHRFKHWSESIPPRSIILEENILSLPVRDTARLAEICLLHSTGWNCILRWNTLEWVHTW